MKKLLKVKLSISLIFILTILSCNNELNEETFNQSLDSMLHVKSDSDILSERTFKLGIRELRVLKNNINSFEYKLVGEQQNINGQVFNPNSKKVSVIKNNKSEVVVSFIGSNNKLNITDDFVNFRVNNKIYEFNNVDLDKISIEDETELFELLLIYNEIINPNLDRKIYINSQDFSKSEECAFNSSSARGSRSYAEIRAERAADEFIDEHEDCELVGEVDSGCLWDDLVCIATQTIECNGETCDE